MSAPKKPELMPWLDYLMYADPLIPYLELFKIIAQAAYYALGGDDLDAALHQARISVDEWVAARHRDAQAQADGPKPISNREAASARVALARQGEGKRRLFERGCEIVARIFHDVLKRPVFDRREPSAIEPDAPPPPPVDPAMVEAIRARAAHLMVMPSPHERHLAARPDMDPFNEAEYAALTARKMHEHESRVQARMAEGGPELHVRPAGEWMSPMAEAAAQREPQDLEISAFCLALAEGEETAVQDMPEESLGKLEQLQKWFAGYDTSSAPRAAVAAFVRRKFDKAFGAEFMRETAKKSIQRLLSV